MNVSLSGKLSGLSGVAGCESLLVLLPGETAGCDVGEFLADRTVTVSVGGGSLTGTVGTTRRNCRGHHVRVNLAAPVHFAEMQPLIGKLAEVRAD